MVTVFFLRIMPNGSMKWVVNKSVKMHRIVKTLGSYPEMSIREARDEFVFLIDSLTQQKIYTALTFSDVYNEWLNLKKTQVKNWKDISQRLDRYILPKLKNDFFF